MLKTKDGKWDVLAVTVFTGIALALTVTIAVRLQKPGQSSAASLSRTVVASRSILFRDDPSGGLAVFEAGSSKPFTVLDREKNSFMNTAVRLYIQERGIHGANREAPFTIIKWSDGRLSLNDPTLSRDLELSAFGTTNAATFAALLPEKGSMR